jgi:hypothetical protein
MNILDEARRVQSLLTGIPIWGSRAEENDMQRMHKYVSVLLVSHLLPRWASRPAIVFKTIAVKMLEREMKETRDGTTTATTGTTISGMTAKTAGTGTGGRKGTRLIVPSTRCAARSREHTGSIATNILIVTTAASSPVISW